ncbi:MAG: PAS domain S-box protein [Candidatus Omnitrophica bacterium]|nr:PAS domain S-box protein [Candidatus Omnitrophota bacterium]
MAQEDKSKEDIKRLNDQIGLILESIGEGIFGLDIDGNTTFANAAALRMIGYEAQEIIGKLQHTLIHHTKADGTPYSREDCPIYRAFLDGQVHRKDDEVFWRKDGTCFPVEYMSTPMRNEQGELSGATVIFRDITERNKAEEELRKQARELKIFHDAGMGREERILELKKEVKRLKEELSLKGADHDNESGRHRDHEK